MKLDEAYTILGLQPGCDSDDMRKAFRQQALKWHPDKNSNSPECTEQFQRIQAAYAKLTREFCGEYSDESEDDYYDDYYDDEDDEDDYDCDCFFHGGIPPWEFFEQLFAAMESGQCNGKGFPPFPFQPGGMFGGHSHPHGHSHGHSSQYREQEADPYYDRSYAYESREERRHREREEQKLEKMWRKEMEMAERENIRAANAAKAARSVAQERNIRAWMRQMPRPTMASRTDSSIELVLVRRGVNTSELPSTCITKLEMRKNGEPNWMAMEVDKDTSKYTFQPLEPGTNYFFRVCGGQRGNGGNEEWGDWSVESRYATTGKTTASAHSDPSGGDRHRKGRNSIGGKPIRATHSTASHHAAGDAAQETHDKAAEEEKARQEEKERAIQKALAEAAADYEFSEMSFKTPEESSKKKKKKKKVKPQAETKVHEHTTEPEMPPLPAPPPPKAPQHASAPTSKPVKSNSTTQPSPEPFQEGLSESEALARAIEESLAIYNDTMTAKKAVEAALGPQHTWDRADAPETPGTKIRTSAKAADSVTHTHQGEHNRKASLPQALQQVDTSWVTPEAAHAKQEKMSPRTMARIHQPKVSTICKFFNTDQGCKWGLNCKFQHLDRSSNSRYNKGAPPAPPPPRTADTRAGDGNLPLASPNSTCTHFISQQGCRFGNQCKFSHDKPANMRCDSRPMPNGAHAVPSQSTGALGNPPHIAGMSQQTAQSVMMHELGQQDMVHSSKFQPGHQPPVVNFQQIPAPPDTIGGPAAGKPLPGQGQELTSTQMAPGSVSPAALNMQARIQTAVLPPYMYGQGPGFSMLPQGESPASQPPVPSSAPLSMLFPAPGGGGSTNSAPAAPPPTSGSFMSVSPQFPQSFPSTHSVFAPVSSAASFPGMDFGVHSMGGMGTSNGLAGDASDMQQEEHSAALNAEAFLNSIQDTSSGDSQLQTSAAVALTEDNAAPNPAGRATTGKPFGSAAAARPKYNPLRAGPK
mmetsp:Transcript_16317/g.41740  ORF Transcript_16317/g.41740 Transcript_16317/m.41740 type:complete len:979 (+) Transcript_16317:138-3074(+)